MSIGDKYGELCLRSHDIGIGAKLIKTSRVSREHQSQIGFNVYYVDILLLAQLKLC